MPLYEMLSKSCGITLLQIKNSIRFKFRQSVLQGHLLVYLWTNLSASVRTLDPPLCQNDDQLELNCMKVEEDKPGSETGGE